jgi:DNA-binding transcriptional LysR family regulator
MNIGQLRYAKTVAETASFSKAAEICCVTQPTLSNAIAQLEEELGGPLFIRTTRKVDLTPFGQHILPLIENVLNAQTELEKGAKAYLNPAQRLIRLGVSPLINARLLAKVIEPFRRNNPHIDLILKECNMIDLMRLLEAQKVDFVFAPASPHKSSHGGCLLYEEPLFFLPRQTAATASNNSGGARLDEIASETFIMVPDGCGLADATRDLFKAQRLKLKEYSGQALSYQVLEDWAALGIGAAILPKSKISAANRSARPLVLKTGGHLSLTYGAAWSNKAVSAPHLRQFILHLKKTVPHMIKGLAHGPSAS